MNVSEIIGNLNDNEKDLLHDILSEIESSGKSNTLESLYKEDYEEIPISIDEFIENPRYAGNFTGNGTLIYPYWRNELRRIFEDPTRYQEIALSGAIGVGKSSIAILALAYILYKLMCLKDPQRYYRLAKGSTIVIAFLNNTLDLSNSVGYQTLQALVQDSEWFLERGRLTGNKNIEYVPDKLIRFKVGSKSGHVLGTNVFAALIDEVNFANGANIQMEQSKIMETYNGVLERMSSRFMVDGKIAGKLFIVSSKKSEYDFLESYIRRKKDDPNVYVCDAKLWDVKPSGTYSGKTFSVAVGGKNVPSRIIENPNIVLYDDNGDSITLDYNDSVKLEDGRVIYAKDIKIGDILDV